MPFYLFEIALFYLGRCLYCTAILVDFGYIKMAVLNVAFFGYVANYRVTTLSVNILYLHLG